MRICMRMSGYVVTAPARHFDAGRSESSHVRSHSICRRDARIALRRVFAGEIRISADRQTSFHGVYECTQFDLLRIITCVSPQSI
ncbi:hypothetical protein BVI2075_120024 [Burkholderia vietnamiensis]|nr:hypothetical protein BVI2075_120024 [Burkholderia vietnamiensis]